MKRQTDVSLRFCFLREFLSRALLSERLEQANPYTEVNKW